MKPHVLRALSLALLILPPLGCTAILDLPDPVASFQWCVDANPARGLSSADSVIYKIDDPAGNWMRGCKCYCPEQNEIMVLGESGMLAPGSGDETWYLNEVTLLRAKAQAACTERVTMMQEQYNTVYSFADSGTVSCADSVADEDPYYSTGCMLDDDICPGGGGPGGGAVPGTGDGGSESGTTGADPDVDTGADTTGAGEESSTGGAGGAMAYGLEDWSTVITCPTVDTCDVAAWFVEELLEDLSVFENDAIQIHAGVKSSLGHQGFRFASLGAESLPAALGFEEGDLLWSVNGILLSDFAAVGRAFEELNQESRFTVQYDRHGSNHQRTIYIALFESRG